MPNHFMLFRIDINNKLPVTVVFFHIEIRKFARIFE